MMNTDSFSSKDHTINKMQNLAMIFFWFEKLGGPNLVPGYEEPPLKARGLEGKKMIKRKGGGMDVGCENKQEERV